MCHSSVVLALCLSIYVLTVTPSTCDCESSQNCTVMGDDAVYSLPGDETQYSITVNGAMSLEYEVTVRADTCDNTLTGDLSPVFIVNLTGNVSCTVNLYETKFPLFNMRHKGTIHSLAYFFIS